MIKEIVLENKTFFFSAAMVIILSLVGLFIGIEYIRSALLVFGGMSLACILTKPMTYEKYTRHNKPVKK